MAAERNPYYSTNGAAAYDVYASNTIRRPVREPERHGLPQEQPLPQKRQRVHAKTAVAPFTVFGVAIAACMMILVIFGCAADRRDSLQARGDDLYRVGDQSTAPSTPFGLVHRTRSNLYHSLRVLRPPPAPALPPRRFSLRLSSYGSSNLIAAGTATGGTCRRR